MVLILGMVLSLKVRNFWNLPWMHEVLTKLSLHVAWLELQSLSTLRTSGVSLQISFPSNVFSDRPSGALSCVGQEARGTPSIKVWHPSCPATSSLVLCPASSRDFCIPQFLSLPPQRSVLVTLRLYSTPVHEYLVTGPSQKARLCVGFPSRVPPLSRLTVSQSIA